MLPPITNTVGLLCALLLWRTVQASTTISTFADDACQDSLHSYSGPNGYPNGTCTDLDQEGTYGSFQVVSTDPGCVVSIYTADTTSDICSGYAIAVDQIAKCYNSTWVYYSIDECDATAAQSSTTSLAATTSDSQLTSATQASSSAAPSTTSAAPASSSSSSSAPSTSHTGAIVGGVVGGVLGLAAIIGLTYFLTRRHLSKNKANGGAAAAPGAGASEIYTHDVKELPVSTEVHEKMAAEQPERPPVELDSRDLEVPKGSRVEQP